MKQENQLAKVESEIITKLVLNGDIKTMSDIQKTEYVIKLCKSLGLNPLTNPFQIIIFQGKEKLYATKDCTEQLRKIHGVGITDITATELRDIYVVTAKAVDKDGKVDAATGAVSIKGKSGDDLANLFMKAETKAKRRVTLSICGLGMLDESEVATLPNAEIKPISAVKNEGTDLETAIPPCFETEDEKVQIAIGGLLDIEHTKAAILAYAKSQTEPVRKNQAFRVAVNKLIHEVKTAAHV